MNMQTHTNTRISTLTQGLRRSHAHTYTYTYMYAYTFTDIYTLTCINFYTNTHTHTQLRTVICDHFIPRSTCIYKHIQATIYSYMYIHTYIPAQAYIHIYRCAHTQTYTYKQTSRVRTYTSQLWHSSDGCWQDVLTFLDKIYI